MCDINWDAVAAIGQCLGALFTLLAVIVALYFSSFSSRPKVKVDISNGFFTSANAPEELFLTCEAINIGVMNVKLMSSGILLPKTKKQLVFPEFMSGKLPTYLGPSENVTYMIPMKLLATQLKQIGYRGTQKLRIYFSDSHGRRYFEKWKIDIDDWSK